MNSSVRLIVFDLGGVMIRLAQGWEDACVCAGVTYRPFMMTPQLHARFEELEALISTGMISGEEYGVRAHTILDGLYAPAEVQAIYQAIIREEFPGIYTLVHALHDAGLKTACLSNTCAPHWTDLTDPRRYPAICSLQFQHASHLFGVAKPDTRIYRRFEETTGMTPAEILFFDDRRENIEAAHACGWHAVHITENPPVAQIREALARHNILLDHE